MRIAGCLSPTSMPVCGRFKRLIKPMKRIGIDAHMLGDHSGGNETFYTGILTHMHVPEDVEVFLFVKPLVDTSFLQGKFKIVRFKSKSAFIRNFVELPFLCLKYKLDLLHTQYFIPFFCPCPLVCTIHDICFEHFSDIFTKREYLRQKLLIKFAAKHSEKIITVSQMSKKDIADKYGIDENKIIVVYNAPKESFKKLNISEDALFELKRRFEIKKRFVLSVGNLQPRKNLVRLIKSFVSLRRQEFEFDYQLVIVGKKAWMFDDVIKEAVANNGDVVFTDYVTEADLVKLYNAADSFVYPSIFEGFGLPPIEAMSCGIPVAVSNQSALPEVVGNAGVYFDPYDERDIAQKILQLTKDRPLRQDLIEKSNMQIKKFSWNLSAKKVVELYEDMLR